MLFAPEKGCDTRKKILAKGDDLTDAMKAKFNVFLAEVQKEYDAAKGKATQMVDSVTAKAEKIAHV